MILIRRRGRGAYKEGPSYETDRQLYLPLVGPFSDQDPVLVSSLSDAAIGGVATHASCTRTNPLKYATLTLTAATWSPPDLSDTWIWCDVINFDTSEIRAEGSRKNNTGDGDDGGSGGGAGGYASPRSGGSGGSNGDNGMDDGPNVGGSGIGAISSPFNLPYGGDGGTGDSSGPNLGAFGGTAGRGRGGGGGGAAYDITGGSGGGGAAGGRLLCIVANRITGSSGTLRARGLLGHVGFSGGVARGGRGGGGAILVMSREYNNVITSRSVAGASNGNTEIYSIASDDTLNSEVWNGAWDYYT